MFCSFSNHTTKSKMVWVTQKAMLNLHIKLCERRKNDSAGHLKINK